MFAKYKPHDNSLYNKLVILSRNIFFYKKLQLKDNFETRIILIFIHFAIVLIVFKSKNKKKFPQVIFDNIFQNIEYHLRELGHGDVSVNKKMKILTKIFYDILLKLNIGKSKFFSANKSLIKKHLVDQNKINDVFLDEFSQYTENFYNFCFELNINSVLKGEINFNN